MGERAKSIGEEAEDKVWDFLDSLGYNIQETNNEEYDIDCIAESPPKNPKYGLAKPRYAPEGLTAFEVKEPTVSKKKVKKFRKKILKYNRENPADQKLKGGIFLVDRRISPKMLEFMKRRQIWGWGIKRQRLYREKIRTFNYWKHKAFITEMPIDAKSSYLRWSIPPPTKLKQLLHFAVFFDDVLHKLSPLKVREVMNKIRKDSINPVMNCGIRPINVFFEFYSIGGLSKHLREEIYKTVIKPWKDQHISVFVNKNPFEDYRAFSTL